MSQQLSASAPAPAQPEAQVWLSDDGILRLSLPAGVRITEESALEIAERVRSLTGGIPRPALLEVTGIGSVDRAARTVYAGATLLAAVALLGTSPVDRVIGNFFIGTTPIDCPTQFFSTETAAVDWLKGFLHD